MSEHLDRIAARQPRDPWMLSETFWLEERDIAAAYLFGSTATGRRGPAPDVDIAVLLAGGDASGGHRFDRALALRGKLVDALGSERVDLVVLNGSPLVLAHRVIRDGRVLFCADTIVRIAFEVDVVRRYCDTAWLRDLFRSALKRELRSCGRSASDG